jgi:hypothetical protein
MCRVYLTPTINVEGAYFMAGVENLLSKASMAKVPTRLW